MKWLTLAAEQGFARAQYSLGLMYTNGLGVPHTNGYALPQDNLHAYMWLNIAASNADAEVSSDSASRMRDKISKEMTPAEIAKTEKLARECIRKKYKGC